MLKFHQRMMMAYLGSVPDEKHGSGGLMEYNTLGYIPYGIDSAGNRTVEYSYDDWCIAQVAKRSGTSRPVSVNISSVRITGATFGVLIMNGRGMRGFIMPRDADGRWLDSVPWGKSKVYHPLIPYRPDTKVAPVVSAMVVNFLL